MMFCRAFTISPLDWGEQPADLVLEWASYLAVEAEAIEQRRRLDEMRSQHKGRVS